MEDQYYYAEGPRCGACGETLGRQQVWRLVFSDDPAGVVERVLSGQIKYVKCARCNFGEGRMWPPLFLFVSAQGEKAVAVAFRLAAKEMHRRLSNGLDTGPVRRRGLDPDRLLRRTKVVHDYRALAEAWTTPGEQIELENDAILAYVARRELSGSERIELLLQQLMEIHAVNLEAEELTPDFLAQVEQYRAALTVHEDPRVPEVIEWLIEHLRAGLIQTRRVVGHHRWLSLSNHNTTVTMISIRIVRSTHNGNFTPYPF